MSLPSVDVDHSAAFYSVSQIVCANPDRLAAATADQCVPQVVGNTAIPVPKKLEMIVSILKW